MATPITATPIIRGQDAKRTFGVMRVEKGADKAVVAHRTDKVSGVRSMFKKVQVASKGA